MVSPTLLRWPSRTGQRSDSPTGCAVLEQTDREESEPDQPIPGGELLLDVPCDAKLPARNWGYCPSFLLKVLLGAVLYNTIRRNQEELRSILRPVTLQARRR